MIEILDPSKIKILDGYERYGKGWHYILDYSWINNKLSSYLETHKAKTLLDAGCGKFGFHKYLGQKFNLVTYGLDRKDFSTVDFVGTFLNLFNSLPNFDIIIWISSIEHNSKEDMKFCYEKSIELLNPKGLFLATFPISKQTFWQDIPVFQQNLSPKDASLVFDSVVENETSFDKIHSDYFLYYDMETKYKKRFGTNLDSSDPRYLTAGVLKIKD